MFKRYRTDTIVVFASTLTLVTGGVAAADPVPQERDTADGKYRLALSLEHVNIQSVPNMAAAPLVREGFVSANVKFTVVCKELTDGQCATVAKLADRASLPKDSLPQATVTLKAQVGCSVQLAGDKGIALSPGTGLTSGLPTTLGGFLPQGGDITTIGIAPTVNNLSPGTLAVTIRPGYVTDFSLGQKAKGISLSPASSVVVSVTNQHVVVDQYPPDQGDDPASSNHSPTCAGPTVIRIRAIGTLQAPSSSDSVDMYGDIYVL